MFSLNTSLKRKAYVNLLQIVSPRMTFYNVCIQYLSHIIVKPAYVKEKEMCRSAL